MNFKSQKFMEAEQIILIFTKGIYISKNRYIYTTKVYQGMFKEERKPPTLMV